MKLSIIVPIYNAEKYIEKCLESLVQQSYANLEIILINDGSTDSSIEICRQFATYDHRIKILEQSNGGPAKARNYGMLNTTGDYIGFVDADDYVEIDFFEKMIQASISSNADIIISNIKEIKSSNVILNTLPKNRIINKNEIKDLVIKQYYTSYLGNLASLFNKIYKKSFIKRNELLIDEQRIRAEDYWFNFEAFSKAESCFAIDNMGYIYNTFSENSIMKSFRSSQYQDFLTTRYKLLEYNKTLLFEINYSDWDTTFINHTNEFILQGIEFRQKKIVKNILKDDTFINCMKNYQANNLHTKIIKLSVNINLKKITYFLYVLWSLRIKK
ncbi:glycosyltransferase family 2 protein [Epilithonimonas lactis]|uniref:glycosyltransferase family 2 protein n=1 Tax=Epilithonimonas lactis TaxID=421072 RepID=UPI00068C3883|nr:glycosyltransferase family 2 protein [Epilithonimonas lactis]SEQ06129.1 Glycosyltransferase involved in cell wall bisynthesis [Epilithonimonas lactis]